MASLSPPERHAAWRGPWHGERAPRLSMTHQLELHTSYHQKLRRRHHTSHRRPPRAPPSAGAASTVPVGVASPACHRALARALPQRCVGPTRPI